MSLYLLPVNSPRKRSDEDEVYVLQDKEREFVKVGITSNIANRVESINKGGARYNVRLHLKLESEGKARVVEKAVLEQFKNKKVPDSLLQDNLGRGNGYTECFQNVSIYEVIQFTVKSASIFGMKICDEYLTTLTGIVNICLS